MGDGQMGKERDCGEYNCVVAADGSGSRSKRISRSEHSYNVNLIQRVRSVLGGLLRPVFTTSLPCQTMATMGPDPISTITHPPPSEDIHLTRLTVSYCLCKGTGTLGRRASMRDRHLEINGVLLGGRKVVLQCFSKCSFEAWTCFKATNLNQQINTLPTPKAIKSQNDQR